jgi:hypothetical protein
MGQLASHIIRIGNRGLKTRKGETVPEGSVLVQAWRTLPNNVVCSRPILGTKNIFRKLEGQHPKSHGLCGGP